MIVHGGKHGDFGGNDMVKIVETERQFLIKHGILTPPAAQPTAARERK